MSVRPRSLKAQYAVEFIDVEKATNGEGHKWEDFQLEYLNTSRRLSIDLKSRQIAWSFTAALDAVVDAILHPGTPHIFTSVNLTEAKEKILYARQIMAAIDPPARPRIERDSTVAIALQNGSRLLSYPCRPIRGPARARLYLDEHAHYPRGLDAQIYTAGLPATIRGDGYIRIGSSPLGASGLFYEIAEGKRDTFPGFVRRVLPWWTVRALCRDVETAKREAPAMPTKLRVARFGSPALIEIAANMFDEDFRQEYECEFVDEAHAWISWELISSNQSEELQYFRAQNVDDALLLLDEIKAAIKDGKIERSFAGGIDVGRHRDLTEFIAVGRATTKQQPLRIMISLDKTPFEDQQQLFRRYLKELPFVLTYVDQNGIGAQLAENLQKTGRAKGYAFTNPSKEVLAVEARVQAEARAVPIPLDRGFAYQVHSIKKVVSPSAKNVFDAERNEKHHADQFWAWALALQAAKDISQGWLTS